MKIPKCKNIFLLYCADQEQTVGSVLLLSYYRPSLCFFIHSFRPFL